MCDFPGIDGVWHYRTGVDTISGDATVDGLRTSRTMGHAIADSSVSRPAEVVFTSPPLGLVGTGERYLIIDIAGRLAIRYLTSSHSLFDLDAVQAFTNNCNSGPQAVR